MCGRERERERDRDGLPSFLLRGLSGAVEKLWCPFCGIFQGIRAVSSGYTNCGQREGRREGGRMEGRRAALSKKVDEANKGRSRSFARSSFARSPPGARNGTEAPFPFSFAPIIDYGCFLTPLFGWPQCPDEPNGRRLLRAKYHIKRRLVLNRS